MNVQTPSVDLTAIKRRQQLAWASGDYAVIGTTLQIVGEMLCEAVDLRSNQRVLDVAAGNGNATLAAARRFADVVSTDYVGALLERGRERAQADRLPVTFQEADAEALPFADGSFDVVLSTFGVMFTPNHAKAASELMRVLATAMRRSRQPAASPTSCRRTTSARFWTVGANVPKPTACPSRSRKPMLKLFPSRMGASTSCSRPSASCSRQIRRRPQAN